jgi:hypothetical protein
MRFKLLFGVLPDLHQDMEVRQESLRTGQAAYSRKESQEYNLSGRFAYALRPLSRFVLNGKIVFYWSVSNP